MKQKIIIISGPTGAGEDSVIAALKKHFTFSKVITSTSRAIRPGEVDGQDYYFLSKDVFAKKIAAGEMLEWKQVYNEYKGFTKTAMDAALKTGHPVLLKLDWQGARTIKEQYPHALAIGIKPPSLEAVKERIRRRGQDDEAMIARRLEYVRQWRYDVYDVVIVNETGKLDQTVALVQKNIQNYLNQ